MPTKADVLAALEEAAEQRRRGNEGAAQMLETLVALNRQFADLAEAQAHEQAWGRSR